MREDGAWRLSGDGLPGLFRSTAKWVTQVETAAQIPEVIQRAFHIAMQGRPGPVVIALPEDMLVETAEVVDAPRAIATAIWPD